MNEEFNPYEQSGQQNAPVNQHPYEQPQYQQPYQQPQYPQQYGQTYQQPQYGQQYYSYPQQNNYYNRPQPVRGGGAAKAFSIVSFVAGCISLFFALIVMVFMRERFLYLSYETFISFFSYAVTISVPGIIFGIIALAKRTNKFPLALLGLIFSAMFPLMLFVSLILYYI